MDGIQAPNLDAYTVGFGGDGVVGVVVVLLVVGLVMVCWLLIAYVIGCRDTERNKLVDAKKEKKKEP